MLTFRAQIVIICLLIVALIGIIRMVQKRKLELKYVLTWLLCDLALLVLSIFPGLINRIAGVFGIKAPMNALFFLGFLFSLMIIFSLTAALSKATAEIRRIAQKMAILEEELLRNDIGKNSD